MDLKHAWILMILTSTTSTQNYLWFPVSSPLNALLMFLFYSIALMTIAIIYLSFTICLNTAPTLRLGTKLHEGKDHIYLNPPTSSGVPDQSGCFLKEHFCTWKYFKDTNPYVTCILPCFSWHYHWEAVVWRIKKQIKR